MASQKSRLYWLLSDSWILSKRSVQHIMRSLDQLMGVTLFPIMFLVLFTFVFGGAIQTSISYVNYLVAGIFIQTLAFGANYTTLNLAIDLQKGVVDRFRSLPMGNSAFLIGHITADLVRNLMSGIIVLVVGLIIGFRPTAGPVEWVLVVMLAIVFSLAISWLSAIMGLMVKSIEAAQWVGFVIIFPLTFASTAFVPTENMPEAMRFFAENQPVSHVISAMRAWLVGTPIGDHALWAFAWCTGIIILAVPLASWMFGRMGKK